MLKFSIRLQFQFRTLYQILDVPENASQAQIKSNYLKIVKIYHPDTNSQQSKNQEYFKEVTAAYTILSNESERRMYDQKIKNSNQRENNNYQQNQEEYNEKEHNKQNQEHNYSKQNYQKNNSQEQNEQTQTYISLVVFFFFAWLSQQNKQKQEQNKATNLIPNKYNPVQTVSQEKKELSEQDCKDLPLDIIKYKSRKGDYIMGQLCYDRLIFDEQKVLKKKKELDDEFQQIGVNNINSQISQQSEIILVDQVQPQQVQTETEKKEILLQNLEIKEQFAEITENEENKQVEQQKINQISDDQIHKDINIDQFENNIEQPVFEQNHQEEQFQQQPQEQSQQEN
ncbi:unnamed protein product [Paramecium octaurelia]|uniref:J domain-containing protein n=1 Tax=Paramecium octaurelia TaxID=43137 RepID=A0A8S1VXK4_PAROT|nr:unnamed protein product [Paramecium octaurelia]